jgi:hypothetical protein
MRLFRHRHRLASVAVVALATVGALAVGPTARHLHLAEQPHAVCAEHGELVHLEPGHSEPGAIGHEGHARSSHVDPGPGNEERGHDHHHCGVTVNDRPAVGGPSREGRVAGAATAQRPWVAPRQAAGPAVAPYRFAPKASPPAVA